MNGTSGTAGLWGRSCLNNKEVGLRCVWMNLLAAAHDKDNNNCYIHAQLGNSPCSSVGEWVDFCAESESLLCLSELRYVDKQQRKKKLWFTEHVLKKRLNQQKKD